MPYGLTLERSTKTLYNGMDRMDRKIGNAAEGITLQIGRKSESLAGALNAYIYLIIDAQLNIQNGAYISALY